jgi:hypothetical protein
MFNSRVLCALAGVLLPPALAAQTPELPQLQELWSYDTGG